MRFDDRLATVLAQPTGSRRDRAIRWRQLVDLVARSAGKGDPGLIDQALAAIRADQTQVDEPVRAATARAAATAADAAPVAVPKLSRESRDKSLYLITLDSRLFAIFLITCF